jgi:hypothetical protein
MAAPLCFIHGCGNNDPAIVHDTVGGTGGKTVASTGGAPVVSSTGGTSGGVGGAPVVSSTGGATGTAGTSGTGGTSGGGVGGSPAGGVGGASGGGQFSPSCANVPLTAAGAAPTKGGTCVAADTQLCYKTCGPQSIGFKSETCTGGTYAEQMGCSFPTGVDYSCYKIPTAIDATCPATAPQASQPCTVGQCVLCNVGGNYLDTSGASKPGYCVCPAPGASGTSKWSCASGTSWPCPAGQGC